MCSAHWKLPEMTPKKCEMIVYPTNQHPTNILGRLDLYSDSFDLGDYFGFQISRFLDVPDSLISRFLGWGQIRAGAVVASCKWTRTQRVVNQVSGNWEDENNDS